MQKTLPEEKQGKEHKLPKELRKIHKIFESKCYGENEHMKRLLSRVIKMALTDLASMDDFELTDDAYYFFINRSHNIENNLTAFENICLLFSLDPKRIRSLILEYCDEKAKKIPTPAYLTTSLLGE